jgi:hypothetical protein
LYFLFAMPVIFLAAEADDAPGLILIGAFWDAFPTKRGGGHGDF